MGFPLNDAGGGMLQKLFQLRPGQLRPEWGVAAVVDTETTGLDPLRHEVLEVAVVLFAFDRYSGHVYGVVDEYSGLREPRRPVPKAVQRVHGISDEHVRGCRLNEDRINAMLSHAEFIVCHNASFDYGFLSRLFPAVTNKRWLCSMNGIPWYRRGHKSKSLGALLRDHGVSVANAHRALDDARATLLLLSLRGPTGHPNLSDLLRSIPGARVGRRSRPGVSARSGAVHES